MREKPAVVFTQMNTTYSKGRTAPANEPWHASLNGQDEFSAWNVASHAKLSKSEWEKKTHYSPVGFVRQGSLPSNMLRRGEPNLLPLGMSLVFKDLTNPVKRPVFGYWIWQDFLFQTFQIWMFMSGPNFPRMTVLICYLGGLVPFRRGGLAAEGHSG